MEHLRRRLAEVHRLLHADWLVAHRPDWSIMLSLLADTLGDGLVLHACRLDPPAIDADVVPHDLVDHLGPQTLHLHGMATVPFAVSQLALRLEETGLFAHVAVVETRRDSFGARKIVMFVIQCVIEDGADA